MRPLAMIEKEGVLIITLDDPAALNEGHAVVLRQQLYTTLATSGSLQVAIDLSAIDYISSSGIALLIGSKRRVEAAGGQIVLFGLQPDVHELFRTMKLATLFEIAGNQAEALQLFSPPPSI